MRGATKCSGQFSKIATKIAITTYVINAGNGCHISGILGEALAFGDGKIALAVTTDLETYSISADSSARS